MYIMGIDPTANSADPEHALGTLGANVTDDGVKIYVYGQADGSGVTANRVVLIESGYAFDMLDTTNSAPGTGQGLPVGVCNAALTADYYGWAQIYGPANVRVAANAAKGTQLNSTGTAGQIDDDATAGSEAVDGIGLLAAGPGSNGNGSGFLDFPHVGRTL